MIVRPVRQFVYVCRTYRSNEIPFGPFYGPLTVGNCEELLPEYIYECQSDAIIPFTESNAATTVEDNDCLTDNDHDDDDRGWKLDAVAAAASASATI